MAVMRVIILALICAPALSSDVPVLFWSPDRPLSDLPQAPSGNSISEDIFLQKYLTPLTGKDKQVIIAFLQDKLHINDISKYADVYNPASNGGAFRNIKGFLDSHFSLELPHVLHSHKALESMSNDFPGAVHRISSPADLASLDLGSPQHYLLVVQLESVAAAKDPQATIASNDETIGKMVQDLKDRGIQYTALYTAETSQEKLQEEAHTGRRLLQTASDTLTTGHFFNVSYIGPNNGSSTLFAYLKSIWVCMYSTWDRNHQPDFCPFNFTLSQFSDNDVSVEWSDNSSSVMFTMEFTDVLYNVSEQALEYYNITIMLPMKIDIDRYVFGVATLSVIGSNISLVNELMATDGYDSIVSILYSYHCTEMVFRGANVNNATIPYGRFVLRGFQIQPNVTTQVFSLSQDCVGWMTTAIWMALFPLLICIIILYFGLYMILSLSTNDRFDDPKGKQLVINAQE